ncbi:transglycosylase [Dispira simplex]|nr:transglycosylase [Dispira simplex]
MKLGILLVTLPTAALSFLAHASAQEQNVCGTREWDFSSPDQMKDFSVDWCPENAYIEKGAMVLRLTSSCGTTVIYPHKLHKGRVEAMIRAGPSSGVVTAFIMQGDNPKDELDLEWVGKDPHRVQSMYFVNGERVAGDELPGYHAAAESTQRYIRYSIDFGPDHVVWRVDGEIVRTLEREEGRPFPSAANLLRMGVWDGSKNQEWAGIVDWKSQDSYYAYVEHLSITGFC